MKVFREEEGIRVYNERGANGNTTRKDGLSEWKSFINKCISYKDLLTDRNSDHVRGINEKWREHLEEKDKRKRKSKDRKVDLYPGIG